MVWSVIDLVLVGLLIASLSPVSIQRTEAGGRTTHPSTIGRPHNPPLKYVIPNLTHNPLQNLWRSQICGTAYLLCVDFVLKPTWTVHRFISDVISGICLRQKYVCPWVGLPSRVVRSHKNGAVAAGRICCWPSILLRSKLVVSNFPLSAYRYQVG
jgi:hypothetical protein